MIDLILRGLLAGAAIGAGSELAHKGLSGTVDNPVWTGHIGGDPAQPALSITRVSIRGRVHWRLYVATNGQWAQVSASYVYAEVLAALQTWETYLANGGTVQAWLAQNAQRATEVAALERSL